MSSEISQLCLESLSPLAEQCAKTQEKDTPLFIATRHFLKVIVTIMTNHLFFFYILFVISDITFCLSVSVLLQLVFDMLVLQKHNTEMTVAAGEALYTLVCLHQVSVAV